VSLRLLRLTAHDCRSSVGDLTPASAIILQPQRRCGCSIIAVTALNISEALILNRTN